MAMSQSTLKTAITTAMTAIGFNLVMVGVTRDGINWADKLADAIATGVYNEITTNARATGTDSNGDTHNLSII